MSKGKGEDIKIFPILLSSKNRLREEFALVEPWELKAKILPRSPPPTLCATKSMKNTQMKLFRSQLASRPFQGNTKESRDGMTQTFRKLDFETITLGM